MKIHIYDSLPSTNTLAKEIAAKGAESGTVIVAKRQTAGRGRYGKSFYSPEGGIYMSIILSTAELKLTDITDITRLAGIKTAQAIETVTGRKLTVKGINDLMLDGRKICGILTETVTSPDGKIDWVVIGIGINVMRQDFPDDIKDIAGDLHGDELLKARIIQSLFNIFL
ncbi:MAG: biotin--[acetyl-CoA-carboxylase] ligase [Oscillospiraceae bacterium]|jgi:BirA family biotin operon repressor/biotin-[acetyl-CoA-carboxylase] ligase|nr:biotin--[acetyl-CoA-carboxylase] ligase [Oscillospiraceae bacterium]